MGSDQGPGKRVLCLNVVSESYHPGGESVHTQFYNLDGVGPSSTSNSGATGSEDQVFCGESTSRWNRRNAEGREPVTRSLSPAPRVVDSGRTNGSPERAASKPPLREDDRGSELWEDCTIESLQEVVRGRKGFSALGESRPATGTAPQEGRTRPRLRNPGRVNARVRNPVRSTGPSNAIFSVYFQNRREGRPRVARNTGTADKPVGKPAVVQPMGPRGDRPTWHDLSEADFPLLTTSQLRRSAQGSLVASTKSAGQWPGVDAGGTEPDSAVKGRGNSGSGESVNTPPAPLCQETSSEGLSNTGSVSAKPLELKEKEDSTSKTKDTRKGTPPMGEKLALGSKDLRKEPELGSRSTDHSVRSSGSGESIQAPSGQPSLENSNECPFNKEPLNARPFEMAKEVKRSEEFSDKSKNAPHLVETAASGSKDPLKEPELGSRGKGSLPSWAKTEMAEKNILNLCFSCHTTNTCKFGVRCKYIHNQATSAQREDLKDVMNRVHSLPHLVNDPEPHTLQLHHEEYEFYKRVGVCPYFAKYGCCRHGAKCWHSHEPVREVLGSLVWNTLAECCPKTRGKLPKITGMVLELPYSEIAQVLWDAQTRVKVTEQALKLLEETVELKMLNVQDNLDKNNAEPQELTPQEWVERVFGPPSPPGWRDKSPETEDEQQTKRARGCVQNKEEEALASLEAKRSYRAEPYERRVTGQGSESGENRVSGLGSGENSGSSDVPSNRKQDGNGQVPKGTESQGDLDEGVSR